MFGSGLESSTIFAKFQEKEVTLMFSDPGPLFYHSRNKYMTQQMSNDEPSQTFFDASLTYHQMALYNTKCQKSQKSYFVRTFNYKIAFVLICLYHLQSKS